MIFDTAVLSDKAEMIAVTGNFRNGDGSKNVTELNSWGLNQRLETLEEDRKTRLALHETSREGISRRSCTVRGDKRTNKRYPRAEMLFCVFNQLLLDVIVAVATVVAKAP